jgi:nucleotide-binding universal stress UspA family protein
MYQRIFVPVDGGPISRLGLDEAIALARFTKGRIHLMHVVDDLPIVTDAAEGFSTTAADIIEMADEGGQHVLAAAKTSVQQSGVECDVKMRRTTKGKIYEQIVEEAKEWNADLIVLGSHGRTGAERLLLGSDAEQVARHTDVPVLLVRQKDADAKETAAEAASTPAILRKPNVPQETV